MRIDSQHASQIAHMIDGRLEGNPSRLVTSIGKIDNAESGSLCFLANPKYEKYLYDNQDFTVLVKDDFKPKDSYSGTLIFVKDVYESFSKILEEYAIAQFSDGVVDTLCSVDMSAVLADNVSIGKFSVIGKNVRIGEDTIVDAQVYIGENVTIGKSVRIYPGVKIYADTDIGDHVIIHSNAVIGSDGFGFTYTNDQFKKIPQVGNVVIESQVEIGSGSTIDRATVGSTVIKKGVKLDNLIQIGHNVVVGENTVIAAQTGVAGSSVIGEGSQIGGQVGIAGHLEIAPYTRIQAKSGVASSIVEKGKKWYGYPILPYGKYLRSYSVFKILPSLINRLSTIEKKLSDLEKRK